MAERYASFRAQGRCGTCGAEALPDRAQCSYCLARNVGYSTERRKRLMARGQCIHCEARPARPGKQACFGCAAREAARTKKNKRKRKDAKSETAAAH